MSGVGGAASEQDRGLDVDVLVPTFGRPAGLAVTLAGLAGQPASGAPRFRVVVSSQDDDDDWAPEVHAMVGILESVGVPVELRRHLPRRGLAEHRQALLDAASAPAILFLDDDIWLAPGLLRRLHETLRREGCGFVGSAPAGWSYRRDRRPDEAALQLWDGPVRPERVLPDSDAWQRHRLHSAANMLHAAEQLGLGPQDAVPYKVAWVGGCVLYDTASLRQAGGFEFWRELPPVHAGEDVVAELRVMEQFGGCAILPTGAWHLELPTTVPDREVDAPRVIAL